MSWSLALPRPSDFASPRARIARVRRAVALAPALFLASSALPTNAEGQGSRTGGRREGFDVQHYLFRVDFPLRGFPDTIAVSSHVYVRRSGRADTLVLDLAPAMQVTRASVGGVSVQAARAGGTIRIPIPGAASTAGDSLDIALEYRGRPSDGLIIRRDSVGKFWTAFADHFPNRAQQWLATVDHPSDKATVEWAVRTPASHRVIANGDLLEETPEIGADGSPIALLTRWRSIRPLYTGVMVIGVAPFATYELGASACALAERTGCVAQSVWVTPDVRSYLPGPFTAVGGIVEYFSRLVAPFPYEKLAHVQSSTRYGGMENASAIFYADGIYRSRSMREGLLAHEIAHQWFGDAVTTREWPHVWLSEGFATYFAALWTEHAHGDSAFLDEMRRIRDDVLAARITSERPVVDLELSDVGKVLNSNVYEKAGFTLHMLRREVGDSAFFRAIRAYYASHKHGNALTRDFQRQVEATSGKPLDWFFEQWFTRPGVANVSLNWRWEKTRRVLLLTASQTSPGAPYRIGLTVDVTDAKGRVQRVRVDLPAARVATLPIPVRLDAAPRAVTFDGDVSFLGRIEVP